MSTPSGERDPSPSGKRGEILRAALDLFSERTYEGTPVPLVARRARSGAGTIYRHFDSKQALANAVYRWCSRSLEQALARTACGTASVREEFSGLWLALWEFVATHPDAFRFLELHPHGGYLDERSRTAGDAVFARIEDFVRRGQHRGVIALVPPAAGVGMLLGALTGLVKEAENGRLKLDDAMRDASEKAVWGMLERRPGSTERSDPTNRGSSSAAS